MKARGAFFALSLILTLALLSAVASAQEESVQVRTIDPAGYERTGGLSEVHSFIWTLKNIDTIAYNITVEAIVPAGWTADVSPPTITDLMPNRAQTVTVNVTSPASISQETIGSVQVVFTIFQDGAIVDAASASATITIPSVYAEKRILGLLDNFLPAPLDNEIGVFIMDVVLWAAIAGAALLVLIPAVKAATAKSKTELDDIIIRIVRTPMVVLLFLYGTLQSLEALDRHIDASIRESLFAIYGVALSFILLFVGYRLFKAVLRHIGQNIAKKTATKIDDVLVPLIEKIGVIVIGFMGLGILLSYLQVDLSLFVAGGVVISMVIAFAAQDTISNFFSGIFLLTDRPFEEGDVIIMDDGDWVQVRKIGMRTARLFRFSDASMVTVPNNTLVNQKVANFTSPKDKARHSVTFNVAYGSDPAVVKTIIQDAIEATPHIIKDDDSLKPVIRFDAMGESSLDFFILVWVDERGNRFTVRDVLNTEVYNRLTAAGIDIPFPQRTVWLKMEGETEPAKVPLDVERIIRRNTAGRTGEADDQGEESGDVS